ncbi:MAG: hypothetical protein ABI135_09485, partial [Rhodoferax sp.]
MVDGLTLDLGRLLKEAAPERRSIFGMLRWEKKMYRDKFMSNLLFDGGHTMVIEGPDGGEQTLYRNTNRTMYLEVRQLRVFDNQCPVSADACVVELGGGTPGSPAKASMRVRGRASLEGGSVSVLGALGTTAHTLDIEFIALDDDVYKREQQEARRCGTDVPYAHANLGFARQQQSAAGSHDWFVVCELAPDTLRAVASALSSGALQAMTIGLTLPEIYSDDWTHPPAQTSWFLGPNYRGNKTDRPQTA